MNVMHEGRLFIDIDLQQWFPNWGTHTPGGMPGDEGGTWTKCRNVQFAYNNASDIQPGMFLSQAKCSPSSVHTVKIVN